jgi:ribonuclease HII
MSRHPDMRYERRLWKLGIETVAGVDEVGVGPMAGPVVAAAVIFAPEVFIKGVHDSKQVPAEKREELYPIIMKQALAVGVGTAQVEEIDRINIYRAAVAACARAVNALSPAPQHVLVDGRRNPDLTIAQTAIVGGDRKSFCIAAASIVAKVVRDRMMVGFDAQFPEYGFANHKGYCTAEHFAALDRLGPSPIHRKSFAPVIAAYQLKLAM